MGFAESLIDALAEGQRYRANKLRMQYEEEDRGIEKEMLQHRLKQMKIDERIRARNAAVENLNMMEGQPAESFPQQPFEMSQPDFSGGIPSHAVGGGGANVPVVDVPGIEELGVPGVQRRPNTLEDILAAQFADLKQKMMLTPRTVARGGKLVVPGLAGEDGVGEDGVIAEGDEIPEQLYDYRTRDAQGNETSERLTAKEIRSRPPAVRARIPSRASGGGGGITRATDAEIDEAVAGVASGKIPASTIPNMTSDLGIRFNSRLKKTGFDVTRAKNDQAAFSKYLQGLNSGQQQAIIASADAVTDALDVLDGVLAAQGEGALAPGTKPYADREAAINAVIQNLAVLKSGGSSVNDKALEAAEKEIRSGWFGPGMIAKAKRLRQSLGYRVGSIRGAFTSSEDVTKGIPGAAPGGAAKKDPAGIRQ